MTPFEEVTQFINDGLSVLKEAAPKKHREVFEGSLDQVFGAFKNLDTSYIAFEIPKKSGEMRQIEAPNRKLKWMQKGLKAQLETLFEAEPGAHGFVPERSIQSNAGVHVGQRYVLNLDIAGFFPSVKRGRVQTVLQLEPIGLSKPAARILAQFCTRNRALPQGAPTSPTLTNLVCMRLDRKLEKLARHYRCRYTRYADDITISGPSKDLMHHLLKRITKILITEGFKVQESKTRILPTSQRQEVTGLSVHAFVNSPRTYRRHLRATLHTWQSRGMETAMEALQITDKAQFIAVIRGRLQHAQHTNNTAEVQRMRATFHQLIA